MHISYNGNNKVVINLMAYNQDQDKFLVQKAYGRFERQQQNTHNKIAKGSGIKDGKSRTTRYE